MASGVSTGVLHDRIPYLAVGEGPPLVMVQGLTAEHDVPKGMERRIVLRSAIPLAEHFTVYVVNRKRGLSPGESMSDIAGHLASAIDHDLGRPVFLQGTSTGGSVALQLAVDRPDLVRRLVVVASAYRLGPHGRAVQAEVARLTRAGDGRGAWAQMMTSMLPTQVRGPARTVAEAIARRMVGSMVPDNPADMLVTLDAEDVFDVQDELPLISAPTLVIGGAKDPLYTRELFVGTAAGVQDGRAHIFEDWGHGRASVSSATRNLTLGFLLAGLPGRLAD